MKFASWKAPMHMKNTWIVLVIAAAWFCSGRCLCGQQDFVGPLAGWKNVKTDYGAAGDGIADDTAAMLNCNLNGGGESGLKGGFGRLDNRGQADTALLLQMLQPLRQTRIWQPQPAPPGVTDVRLYRVICNAGKAKACVELRAR